MKLKSKDLKRNAFCFDNSEGVKEKMKFWTQPKPGSIDKVIKLACSSKRCKGNARGMKYVGYIGNGNGRNGAEKLVYNCKTCKASYVRAVKQKIDILNAADYFSVN